MLYLFTLLFIIIPIIAIVVFIMGFIYVGVFLYGELKDMIDDLRR